MSDASAAHPSKPTPLGYLRRRWWLSVPALMAVMGMLIAWAAVTTGQDARRQREFIQLNYDRAFWKNELTQRKLAGKSPADIAEAQKNFDRVSNQKDVISYARYGRQFTSWDGYRYEEIVDLGYAYHQPWAAAADRKTPDPMLDVGDKYEKRSKNVVWYPLYPSLAQGLMFYLPLSSTMALTVVSWTCCLVGAMVMFAYARRYYAQRLGLSPGQPGTAKLGSAEYASLWAVGLLLFGPCAVFLYANFTESLFVLLLATFLFCLHERWWWRAAMVAAVASSCRSQGVLFGPILAATYLWRSDLFHGGPQVSRAGKRLGLAAVMGFISGLGLLCYAIFLYQQYGDPLAFMHAQRYWNVGIGLDQILYAANPLHALGQEWKYIATPGPVDWPKLWEAFCLIWPPVVLALWGWRYLSFELQLMAWILWGLPYVSNSLAGNPPMQTQWMSMGRFMAVSLPIYIMWGAMFEKRRWLGMLVMVPWVVMFGIFCSKYGNGAWVG